MIFQVCEPLYSANLNAKTKFIVNQGGTSSAKTYTIMQVLCYIALTRPGSIITVVGQDIPNLKKGAIRDTARIFASSPFLQRAVPNYKLNRGYNKTDRIYEFSNGSIIEYTSYENEQDAKSGKRDYLFVNEANGVQWEVFWQLAIRTTHNIYIDYNPSSRFWAHEKLHGRKNVTLLISDHRHNRFLSQAMHDEIENIEDPEYWKVYARGLTGQIKGLIYTNWTKIDIFPALIPSVYGMDFGFNHKMALTDIAKDGNNLFWDQLIYESEMTISDLVHRMRELEISRTKPIFADHAAADKIEDLKRAGYNVFPADKDVKNGIDFVKRHNLYVTKRSTGLHGELGTYKWKEKDGLLLEEPVKFKDDGMDSGRYGSYSGFRKDRTLKISNGTEVKDYDDYDLGLLDGLN